MSSVLAHCRRMYRTMRSCKRSENVARRTLEQIKLNDRGLQERAIATLVCQEYLSTYAPVVDACESTLGASRCETELARCAAGAN